MVETGDELGGNLLYSGIVLAGTDAAQQASVLTFVAGEENVAVGCSEIDLVDVARVRFEGNDRAALGSDLPPLLRRGAHRRHRA